MPAEGIEYTIVNGDVLYEHGDHSGYLPGRVLRSGADCRGAIRSEARHPEPIMAK
jgi:N-acyl-D-aspartate/D-glutamate deacylase